MLNRNLDRLIEWGAIAIALMLGACFIYHNQNFYHDDAFITLRYASNFLDGKGIVWNPGEYVQGYSNFLQLVIIAGLGYLGFDLRISSQLIGITAYLLLPITATFLLSKIDHKNKLAPVLPAVFIYASAPIVSWAIGGLEGVMFSLLATVGILLFASASQAEESKALYICSGISLGLACLTRPDGIVFAALAFIWLLRDFKHHRSFNILHFSFASGLIILSYLAWQYYYYGDVLPNTFYVKGTALNIETINRGLSYLWQFTVQPPFLMLITAAVFLHRWLFSQLRTQEVYLAANILFYSLFVVCVGGDHMEAFRLLLPAIALLACLLQMLLENVIARLATHGKLLIYLAALLLSALQIGHGPLNPLKMDDAALNGIQIGRFISENWPENAVIALNSAGAVPYHAPGHRFIDMLGLNDKHIARREIIKTELPWQKMAGHLKGDGNYILLRKPDYIILGPSQGSTASQPWFLSDLEISRNPDFYRLYEKHAKLIGTTKGPEQHRLIFTYYRRIQ